MGVAGLGAGDQFAGQRAAANKVIVPYLT
jgi:hypothetical protein